MALTIMTNELALAAQRNLNNTENRLSDTVQKLASGSRIVRAKDDPAGLAISDGMNATIRSLGQAMRNAQDGISLIQVFEGGTTEISNMLVRLRELSIQSASDTVGDSERSLINNEMQELKQEVSRIAKTTNFAGKNLLAGQKIHLDFQIGTNNDPEKDRIVFDPGASDLTAEGLGVDGLDISTKDGAQEGLETIDAALTTVNQLRARIGASQNRLQTTINSQSVAIENLSAAKSRIKDADVAQETTNLARENILRQAGVAVLTQANDNPRIALSLLRG
jgi:flagellin